MEAGLALRSLQVGTLFIPEIDIDPSLAMTKLRKEKSQHHKDGPLTES